MKVAMRGRRKEYPLDVYKLGLGAFIFLSPRLFALTPARVESTISGATVTILVMADSIVRSAVRLIREGRLGSGKGAVPAQQKVLQEKRVDSSRSEIRDWSNLVGDGSVRRMKLSVGEINAAFAKSGKA